MTRSLIITDARIWTAETEYAATVAAAEERMGLGVTVAAPKGSALFGALAGEARSFALPGAEPSRSPADFLADVRFLADLVLRSRFDVVHSSRSTAHLLAALAVGRRAPLVHLRGSASVPKGHVANRYVYRRLTRCVVVSSSRVRGWVVERLRMPADRVYRIFAPVDTDVFHPRAFDRDLAGELGVGGGGPLVVNVARLAPVKGQEVLIDAFARVVAGRPDAVLVLVGEAWSGQPEGLKRRATERGIESSVVFAGWRTDVTRFLAAAAVCVSSSLGSEENSRAVSEYMASARPIVATRVGVVPELVDDETAFLVDPGDSDGLAAAIGRTLSDPQGAQRMAERARERAVERLSQGAFARQLEGVLQSAGVCV